MELFECIEVFVLAVTGIFGMVVNALLVYIMVKYRSTLIKSSFYTICWQMIVGETIILLWAAMTIYDSLFPHNGERKDLGELLSNFGEFSRLYFLLLMTVDQFIAVSSRRLAYLLDPPYIYVLIVLIWLFTIVLDAVIIFMAIYVVDFFLNVFIFYLFAFHYILLPCIDVMLYVSLFFYIRARRIPKTQPAPPKAFHDHRIAPGRSRKIGKRTQRSPEARILIQSVVIWLIFLVHCVSILILAKKTREDKQRLIQTPDWMQFPAKLLYSLTISVNFVVYFVFNPVIQLHVLNFFHMVP